MAGTVCILGAGATKACGGPLTNEILPEAFAHWDAIYREGFLENADGFLRDWFNVPADRRGRRPDDYPPLPFTLALLDTAIDKGHTSRTWTPDGLARVRASLDYIVFAILQHKLAGPGQGTTLHRDLFRHLFPKGQPPKVVSLNYDIIADNTLVAHAEEDGRFALPDYGTDIATPFYREHEKSGTLLKLHGSLNWIHCPGCHRLDVGVDRRGRFHKMLDALYRDDPKNNDLGERYACRGFPCPRCGAATRPVLITPTHAKDYRNPHITSVWYGAEQALRGADHAVVVGYSLPEDDLEVAYLLKRALGGAGKVTVIDHDKEMRGVREHPVGRRYRALFGDRVAWHPEGFAAWVKDNA